MVSTQTHHPATAQARRRLIATELRWAIFCNALCLLLTGLLLISCQSSPSVDTIDTLVGEPTLYINEVLAHTDLPQIDAIELFNPSDDPLDISGWYLSDKKSEPKRVRLPADTIVPANGYLVIDENIMRYGSNGFALSESGETVYLSAAGADDELTGFVAKAQFDASPNGISFGRIQDDYVLLTHPTLGQPNAAPLIGPIIIKEILYSANSADTHYILFENITNTAISLYDPENPDNVWRIRKTVDFDFPQSIKINPHEQFIVAADPNAIASHTDLRVFGPYEGQLEPDGNKIELKRPDTPNDDKVPYIAVDFIDFTNTTPWPRPDQTQALARVSTDAYANDPANWMLAPPLLQR